LNGSKLVGKKVINRMYSFQLQGLWAYHVPGTGEGALYIVVSTFREIRIYKIQRCVKK
jgi:hypothetical protein